jgi:hypothetical protein
MLNRGIVRFLVKEFAELWKYKLPRTVQTKPFNSLIGSVFHRNTQPIWNVTVKLSGPDWGWQQAKADTGLVVYSLIQVEIYLKMRGVKKSVSLLQNGLRPRSFVWGSKVTLYCITFIFFICKYVTFQISIRNTLVTRFHLN